MPIRTYIPEDKEACLQIFDSNYPKYFADHERQEFINWLDKSDREDYFVIEEEDKNIIACGGLFTDTKLKTVGLAWGMVQSKEQGKGYGKVLAAYRLQLMKKQFPRHDKIVNTSQHTYRFFEKLGFKVENIIPDGFGKGFDKYQMKK